MRYLAENTQSAGLEACGGIPETNGFGGGSGGRRRGVGEEGRVEVAPAGHALPQQQAVSTFRVVARLSTLDSQTVKKVAIGTTESNQLFAAISCKHIPLAEAKTRLC
jgi:hypothetical protein